MKRLTILTLTVAALAGCGGGDDDASEPAAQTGGTANAPADEAPARITGEPTPAKLAKAMKLTEKNGAYTSEGGCVFDEIVIGKAAIEKAREESPKGVITDDGETFAVVQDNPEAKCLYAIAFKIKALR
jgi:hypothetical protein